MRDKFWEISGTKLGNILKAPPKDEANPNTKTVEIKKEDGQKPQNDEEFNYKADSQYADALRKKNTAVSEFAKNKTLK